MGNKMFNEFIEETKSKLMAFEMDATVATDYTKEDIDRMEMLRNALYD